jgi:death-on-curing protein
MPKFNHPELDNHFDRSLKMIPKADREYPGCSICTVDVLEAHYHIVDHFMGKDVESEKKVGGVGPKDINLLCSAVARQLWGVDQNDIFDTCATLLYGLIENHPFHDCNKRTAILTAFYYLKSNGRIPASEHAKFEKLTVNIASDKLSNYSRFKKLLKKDDGKIKVISAFLRRETRAIEYDKPRITFRELKRILTENGFEISNAHKGYIDVYQIQSKKTFLGLGQKGTEKVRVCRMVYQGDSKEVNSGGLARVREKTGLTLAAGYDSAAFFRGADSLPDLIEEYSDLLTRLADK